MKRGKKSRKRKRGPASRARIRQLEYKQRRFKELKEETRECYENILERYPLSVEDQAELAWEWELGLRVLVKYENAISEAYRDLGMAVYNSRPLSDFIDSEISEVAWRASFDLANALGLATITIDEAGNVSGKIINY